MPPRDEREARRRAFLIAGGGNVVATLVLWTLYLVTVRQSVLSLSPAWLAQLLAVVMRFVAFLLPTLLAIWLNPWDRMSNYRSMFGHVRSGVMWGIAVGAAIITLNVLTAGLLGRLSIPSSQRLYDATFVALSWAVLFEELTYRGYLLRDLQTFVSSSVAAIISALVFVAIHVPGWVLVVHLPADQFLRHSVSIFLLGLVLAWSLKRSRSIYAPLIAHAANNFASIIFRI